MACVLFDPRSWGDAKLQAWVLMPDHLHVLVALGAMSLSEVVRRAKGRSAFEFNRSTSRRGEVWARAFHDRAIRGEGNLQEAARYLVRNPLRAGLVEALGAYPFWGSVWTGPDGPLQERLEPRRIACRSGFSRDRSNGVRG